MLAEARNADLIHTTTFNGTFPAWIASKILRKKSVVTVHEVWLGKWQEYTSINRFGTWIYNLMEWFMYKMPFDKYIAVSNSTRKQLLNIGIKAEKAVTVYNAVDYKHFDPKKHKRNTCSLLQSYLCTPISHTRF